MAMQLPLSIQVETEQDVASQRSTRIVWTGFGVAVLMLVGLAVVPLASHATAKPSGLSPELAFNPSLSALSPAGSRLSGLRPAGLPVVRRPTAMTVSMQEPSPFEGTPLEPLQKRFDIFTKSRKEGFDFKQAAADAIAGEYDKDAVTAEVKALASSAPLVMFTWESSPSCKKAVKYLSEVQGVQPKIIRLDDPWSEGNPKRAALGRLTGKSSVPSIWIGGQYIGGCDDGTKDAPGLVPLAFKGQLYSKLEAAGALPKGSAKQPVAGEANVQTAVFAVEPRGIGISQDIACPVEEDIKDCIEAATPKEQNVVDEVAKHAQLRISISDDIECPVDEDTKDCIKAATTPTISEDIACGVDEDIKDCIKAANTPTISKDIACGVDEDIKDCIKAATTATHAADAVKEPKKASTEVPKAATVVAEKPLEKAPTEALKEEEKAAVTDLKIENEKPASSLKPYGGYDPANRPAVPEDAAAAAKP